MPNWVFNSLCVSGEPESITKLKEQLNKSFTTSHDEWVSETNSHVKKEFHYANPIIAFRNIIAPTDLEAYHKPPTFRATFQEMLNGAGNDWYSWNIRNWGTKWDVAVYDNEEYSDTEIMDEGSGFIIYKFNTAWSPPFPVIQKLSKQYPDLLVDLEYEEEGGWGGEITFRNGEIIDQKEYDNRCSECDSHDTMEWNEEDGTDTCKECGYEW